METSPNHTSEIEFEELLAAASQTSRDLRVLTVSRELPTPAPHDHHDNLSNTPADEFR